MTNPLPLKLLPNFCPLLNKSEVLKKTKYTEGFFYFKCSSYAILTIQILIKTQSTTKSGNKQYQIMKKL